MKNKLDYGDLIPIADKINMSPRKLEDFLVYLLEHSSKKIVLQRKFGLPSSIMKLMKKELGNFLEVNGDSYSLDDHCLGMVNGLYVERNKKDEYIEKRLIECRPLLEQIEKNRKRSKREIDQFRAIPETVINKIRFLYKKGELEGRTLMFMGDNDLASIIAASTHLPKNITVFDIDKELVSLINQLNKEKDLEIKCIEYNAKKEFPKGFRSKFDVSITDPPYTLEGIRLFISRCIQGNRRENGAIVINYGYSIRSREKVLPIQNVLTEMGLLMEEVIPEFSRYFSAQSIGCQSSLYVCRTTPKTRHLVKGEFKTNIYTKS